MKKKKKILVKGPTLFEVEYLRQLRAELESFLKSRSFSTIQELRLNITGAGYDGSIQIRA